MMRGISTRAPQKGPEQMKGSFMPTLCIPLLLDERQRMRLQLQDLLPA